MRGDRDSIDQLRWGGFAVLSLVAMGYCFTAGDIVDHEAEFLIGADSQGGSGYALAMGWLHDAVGIRPSAVTLRGISTLALFAAGWTLAVGWVGPMGRTAALAALMVFAASAGPMALAGSVGPEAPIVLLVIGSVTAICHASQTSTLRDRILSFAGFGAAVTLAAALLVGIDASGWATVPRDALLAPVYAFGLTLPWLFGLAPLAYGIRACCSGADRLRIRLAVWMAIAAPFLGLLAPSLWRTGATLSLAGVAVIVGRLWQEWEAGRLPVFPARIFDMVLRAWMFSVPLIAASLVLYRIGTRYEFMERYQALLLVSLGAFGVAWAAVRDRRRLAFAVPVLLVMIAAKGVHVHAWIPERDADSAVKGYARAIGSRLPEGAVLHTDLPLRPAFRYYLGASVEPLAAWDPTVPGERFVWATEEELCETSIGAGAIVRRVRSMETRLGRRTLARVTARSLARESVPQTRR